MRAALYGYWSIVRKEALHLRRDPIRNPQRNNDRSQDQEGKMNGTLQKVPTEVAQADRRESGSGENSGKHVRKGGCSSCDTVPGGFGVWKDNLRSHCAKEAGMFRKLRYTQFVSLLRELEQTHIELLLRGLCRRGGTAQGDRQEHRPGGDAMRKCGHMLMFSPVCPTTSFSLTLHPALRACITEGESL
jgi:hypothetical protein